MSSFGWNLSTVARMSSKRIMLRILDDRGEAFQLDSGSKAPVDKSMLLRVCGSESCESKAPAETLELQKKLRKQLVWEDERPRKLLRVRVFLTTGSRGRSPSLFSHGSRGWG